MNIIPLFNKKPPLFPFYFQDPILRCSITTKPRRACCLSSIPT